MKTPAERGPIGAWAYEARADADLSVEQVADQLARMGNPIKPASIRGVESGTKKPSRRLLRALSELYGKPVPGEVDMAQAGRDAMPGLATLVEVLERQAAALTALAERLGREDEEREARLRAVEAELAQLRARRAGGASPRRSAPAETMG